MRTWPREREIPRASGEIARTLDDDVKPFDFPTKPAYFRSSVCYRRRYLFFILLFIY